MDKQTAVGNSVSPADVAPSQAFFVEGVDTGEDIEIEATYDQAACATDKVLATLWKAFDITFSSFIPANNLEAPPHLRCLFFGGAIPRPRRLFFSGDDRGFSSTPTKFRTLQTVRLIPDATASLTGFDPSFTSNQTGQTREYASDAIANNGVLDAVDEDVIAHDCTLFNDSGVATNKKMSVTVTRVNPTTVRAILQGSANNPLAGPGAPAIDWEVTVEVDVAGTITCSGRHDGFPAYEIYVNGAACHTHFPGAPAAVSSEGTPTYSINQVRKLFPPLDVSF